MRLALVVLTLILTLANAASVAQVDADVANASHHQSLMAEMHAHAEGSDHHGHTALDHHCCHTHAHAFLPTHIQPPTTAAVRDLSRSRATPSARLMGYAPPTPPPKA